MEEEETDKDVPCGTSVSADQPSDPETPPKKKETYYSGFQDD